MQNEIPEYHTQPSLDPKQYPDNPKPDFFVGPTEPPSRSRDVIEYLMLGAGIVTISAFLLNNGYILKFGLIVVLVIALYYITRGITSSNTTYTISKDPTAPLGTRKQPSVLKMLGFTLLVIVMLPVLGYTAMFALLIIMLTFGGGNMGT